MIEPWLELEQLIAADPVKGAYFPTRALSGAGEPLYRSALWRIWDDGLPLLAVVGLNPATAGWPQASRDDMTSTKLVGFAQRQGYGGYVLGNLYQLRSKDPMQLLVAGTKNAEGYGARDWLRAIVSGRDALVAWGVVNIDPAYLLDAEKLIFSHAKRTFCLGYTSAGFPRHPSRIAYDTPWEEWQPSRRIIE